eukprot:s264_g25.t1
MTAEHINGYMEEGEESETHHEDVEVEAGAEAEVDAVVEPEAKSEEAYDFEDADAGDELDLGAEAADEFAPGDMEMEHAEDEEEEDELTDYGSVMLVMEDFSARGVEHYIIKRLTYLRSLPMNQLIWDEIRELMTMQKEVQLEGIETRKKAIRYFIDRRRYMWHYEMGHIDPGERMEESHMLDEWAAVHNMVGVVRPTMRDECKLTMKNQTHGLSMDQDMLGELRMREI